MTISLSPHHRTEGYHSDSSEGRNGLNALRVKPFAPQPCLMLDSQFISQEGSIFHVKIFLPLHPHGRMGGKMAFLMGEISSLLDHLKQMWSPACLT